MSAGLDELAFPKLTAEEIRLLRPFASEQEFADGAKVFEAGKPYADLFVVETGTVEIRDPGDHGRLVTTHMPGEFSGDIDLLTRRPALVDAIAGGATRVLRVPGSRIREMLNRVPGFGEKLMKAITRRRQLLMGEGVVGLRVVGPGRCRETALIREFLYKSFVPFTWFDPATPKGREMFVALGSPPKLPVVVNTQGRVLVNPSLAELARSAGIWQACPDQDVDFAIIGAGPAGISAAVYAASEGLSTVVFDRLGPGGQAGGSSRIENFIGFPAGLSGMDLATRGVLQMLKFGAQMVAPISVEQIETAASPGMPHVLHLDCGAKIRAHTILVATGVRWRRLDAPGADRFEGAGIYYVCTSVEAFLYNTSDVAVVGGGNSAGQAAMYLAECCPQRRVHMLIRRELGPGMSEYLVSRLRAAANVTVHENVEISAVIGERRIEEVELHNKQADTHSRLSCAAVFVFIGAEPSAPWLPTAIARDKLGYLLTGTDVVRSGHWPLTDRDPCPLETTVPRILAAGDVRSGSTKRVGFAVGDGSLAVTCVHRLRATGG